MYHNHVDKKLYNEANLEASYVKPLNLSTTDEVDISKYVHEIRTGLDVMENQDLMIGLAWVLPIKKQFFTLFPEVIYVDVIKDTNKDDRPLLTVTGKDSNGKMYTFLRAFLPNERQWVYRWVFFSCFPNIFP